MKGFWRRVVCALVIAGAAWVTLLGCAHDDSTLFVFDVLAGSVSGTSCTFTADPTQPAIGSGVLDVGVVQEYDAEYLLANQMVAQADPSIPQTESGFITLDHVNVRITDASGKLIRTYSTPVAATAFPAAGTTPSFVAVGVPTIDQTAVKALGTPGLGALAFGSVVRVETFVQFFGKTTGGTSVESNTFQFPVDVCWGCLVAWGGSEISGTDPKTMLPINSPNCENVSNATTTNSTISTPCRIGQDAPVDCALCLGSDICFKGPNN